MAPGRGLRAVALLATLWAAVPLLPARRRAAAPLRASPRGGAPGRPGGLNSSSAVKLFLRSAGATEAEPAKVDDDAALSETPVLEYLLEDAGFTQDDVSGMVERCPELAARGGNTSALLGDVRATVQFLSKTFAMRKYDLRKVVREQPKILLKPAADASIFDTGACPAVLAATSGGPAAGPRSGDLDATAAISDTVLLLTSVGVRTKHVKEMVVRWPQLLSIEMPQMLAVTDYINSLGFERSIGSLYRANPWLLAAPVATVRDAATVLRDEVGVTNVENVVRAYPRALLSDRESLLRPLDVLRERAGVDEADLASLVEAFPLLFGLDDAMGPVLDFWLDELKINAADVPRICRAFPSLLGVDVATMRANVKFLEEIGVVNTARFVTRLPPVLAYDVDRDLRPKMAELVKCALSVYDIVRFPAYFSYPLDGVIKPRTAFLKQLGVPITTFPLQALFTPGDKEFASRVLGVDPKRYAAFKKDLLAPTNGPVSKDRATNFPPKSTAKAEGRAFPSFLPGPPEAAAGKKAKRQPAPRNPPQRRRRRREDGDSTVPRAR